MISRARSSNFCLGRGSCAHLTLTFSGSILVLHCLAEPFGWPSAGCLEVHKCTVFCRNIKRNIKRYWISRRICRSISCSASGHHGSLYAKIHAMCYHRSGLCSVSTEETAMVKHVKVIVEKHPDGYVAYPLGLKGVIVGEGDTYEEALADVQSAITFHIETFGAEVVEDASSVLDVFVAEAGIPL